MLTSLTAFAAAGITAFFITPLIGRLAKRFNAVDKPDRRRKRHRRLVPLWGGLAIFPALAIGVAASLYFTSGGKSILDYYNGWFARGLPWLAAAGAWLTIVGLYDDKKPLPPKVKMAVQLSAALLVVIAGYHWESVSIPFTGRVCLIWMGVGSLLAVFWLTFMMNAFNFIDGLDGLASGQAVIAGLGLSLGAWLLGGHSMELITRHQCGMASLLAAASAGAGLGFWRYNRWPAKIFLGDAGSTLLGFSLSLSVLMATGRATTAGVFLFPLLVLGWPIMDALLAMLRRMRRGVPISKPDYGHLHHRLLHSGFTKTSAVALVHILTAILVLAGLVMAWL